MKKYMFKKAISLVAAAILSMVATTQVHAEIIPSAGDDMSNYTASISGNSASSINANSWYVMQFGADWWAFLSTNGSTWSAVNNGFFNTKEYDDASAISDQLIHFPGGNSIQSVHGNYLSLDYGYILNRGWSISSSNTKNTLSLSAFNNHQFSIYNTALTAGYAYLRLSNNGSSPVVSYSQEYYATNNYRSWVIYPVSFKEKTTVSFLTDTKTVGVGDGSFKYEATVHPKQHTTIFLSVSSYKSSNTNVARVANDGTITVVGKGDAVITATYNGSSDYVGSEGSFTLHVESDKYWAQTQTIESGKKYIVVYQGNSDATSGYLLNGSNQNIQKIDVTINNKVIQTEESYAFTITKNGNYYRMLGANGLYINPGNNSQSLYGDATDLSFAANGGGFIIRKGDNGRYFSYELGNGGRFISSSNNPRTLYLYTPISISYPETSVNLKLGETVKKVPTVTPSTVSLNFTYTSSNTGVATIAADGTVTAKGMGTTTITARYGTMEASYVVIVTTRSPNLQFATVNGVTSVEVGQELATTCTREGDGAVTYTSSDNSIATINEQGVIRGVMAGKVTLTATVAESGNYTAQSKSVEIAVTLKDPKLTFAAENGVSQIYVGQTLKTVASSLSDATITYSSSAVVIASVDSKGVIIGEGVGTATITATIVEEGAYTGATKSISIKVIKRKTTVEPSFTTKSIRVGGTSVLKLITESNGNQHFVSDHPEVATVNATTGEIIGIAEGTTTIRYWIDASAGYEASEEGTVTVVVSSKPEPNVEVNPSSVSLAIGGRKEVVVDLGDYTGTCSAFMNNDNIASVVVKSHDPENHLYVFSVTGLSHGETFLTLSLEETNTYLPMEIKVPVSVLNIYQYELNVVNAPVNGVEIQIWGVTYTGSSIFNSSHDKILTTDVNVHYLPSYQSKVEISDRLITVTYSLKEPTKGSFLRLKNFSCGQYATMSANGEALGMAVGGLDNIIYYDEQGHFLFYKNGQFVKEVNKMAAVDEAANADVFSFTRGTGDYSECYSIQTTGGYLHGSSNGTSIGSTSGSEYAYWYVEMLESLPVSVSANGYGYASLYCPVELEVAGGLSAYYIDSKSDNHDDTHNAVVEYRLHLEQLFSVIPAKTPAILVGVQGTTYNCPIKYEPTQSAPVSADALTGHCAAQVSADVRSGGTLYALQASKDAEKVGFYPWTKETLAGFKCYFIETNATPAPYYRFVFGEEGNGTGLSEPLIETAEESLVFNLQGQRVADTPENLPAGLYIVRGKKVIIK